MCVHCSEKKCISCFYHSLLHKQIDSAYAQFEKNKTRIRKQTTKTWPGKGNRKINVNIMLHNSKWLYKFKTSQFAILIFLDSFLDLCKTMFSEVTSKFNTIRSSLFQEPQEKSVLALLESFWDIKRWNLEWKHYVVLFLNVWFFHFKTN